MVLPDPSAAGSSSVAESLSSSSIISWRSVDGSAMEPPEGLPLAMAMAMATSVAGLSSTINSRLLFEFVRLETSVQ